MGPGGQDHTPEPAEKSLHHLHFWGHLPSHQMPRHGDGTWGLPHLPLNSLPCSAQPARQWWLCSKPFMAAVTLVPGEGLPAHLPRASPGLAPELAEGTVVTPATSSHQDVPPACPRLLPSCVSSLDLYSPCLGTAFICGPSSPTQGSDHPATLTWQSLVLQLLRG